MRTSKRLLWQLYPISLIFVLIAVIAFGVLAYGAFTSFAKSTTARNLETQTLLVRDLLRPAILTDDDTRLQARCRSIGAKIDTRITVIGESGTVRCDSLHDPAHMDNHADRPEVTAALEGQDGQSMRYSATAQMEMLYNALPLRLDDTHIAIVRTSMPMVTLLHSPRLFALTLAVAGVLILALTAIFAWIATRRIAQPLGVIQDGAQRFSRGDLSYRLPRIGSRECQTIVHSLNQMATEIESRLQTIRKLEQMRREFVGNVSHELMTPITAIIGFVETLRDGALDDPDRAQDFLRIIGRHAKRLRAIVGDLLSLSRIEQDEESNDIRLESIVLGDIITSAIEICRPKADDQQMTLLTEIDPSIEIMANAILTEQAIVNLVDNAIKYSDANDRVWIRARREDNEVLIEIEDEGIGIPSDQIPRLFERFYRVEKARSRRQGGTGLGLAIVKHIIHSMGGSIAVASTPGVGSTFTLHLKPSP